MADDFSTPITLGLGNMTGAPNISLGGDKPTSLFTNTFQRPTSTFSSGNFFSQKYNELYYNVELYLDNSGNLNGSTENRYPINPAAVLNLSISDNINDWVTEGSMIFLYAPEESQGLISQKGGQSQETIIKGARENGSTFKSYTFRADGFDLLRVMMSPKPPDTNTNQAGGFIDIKENDPLWTLCYVFSVYDVEDVSNLPGLEGYSSNYIKCIKVYFRDVRQQILQSLNIEYSTALSSETIIDPSYDSVDERNKTGGLLKTGKALFDIFQKALTDPEIGSYEFLQLESEQWDQGSTKLFYTSPANFSAAEDIDYIYAHHLSESSLDGVKDGKDLCLLCTVRSKDTSFVNPIALIPIKDFFEKAGNGKNSPGELQLEHFFVTNHTDVLSQGASVIQSTYKAPFIPGGGDNIDIQTAKYGQILVYGFVDMAADINAKMFRTSPIHSVDIANRVFRVEFEGNRVEDARKAIAETYIKQLYKKDSGEEKKLFLPTLHKSKEKINIFPEFSLHGDNKEVRRKKGLGNLIYTGLFQNACICFKVLGLSIRSAGTFIGIDRTDGSTDDDYSNKVYGQYFVVRVDHVFEAGTYINIIWAIKLHRFEKSSIDFGEIL